VGFKWHTPYEKTVDTSDSLAWVDRVGLFLPMIPEVVISLLAVSRIGGIVVPIFLGFGPEAIYIRSMGLDL